MLIGFAVGFLLLLICGVALFTVGVLILNLVLGSLVVLRLSFSVLLAGVLSTNVRLVDKGLVNFLLLLAICYGVIWLLSALFPKLNRAIKGFCATLVSMLVSGLLGTIVMAVFPALAELTYPWLVDGVLKVMCIWFVFNSVMDESRCPTITSAIALRGGVANLIGRIAASVLYGFSAIFLFCPVFGGWPYTELAGCIIMALFTVGTFLLDPVLFDQA